MKTTLYFLWILGVLVCLVQSVDEKEYVKDKRQQNGWKMVWNDEFDGPELDLSKWAYEVDCWGGGNNELQCYTPREDNVKIVDGKLVITAQLETYRGPPMGSGCTNNNQNSCTWTKSYTSGRVRTKFDPNGSWRYGRFEMVAKLPNGRHLWPAFWMLPTDEVYGTWAASGEIDIMEYRGQATSDTQGTVHYGGEWPYNRYKGSGPKTFPFDFSEDFHEFALEWERDEMRWYVDDQLFHTQNLARSWYEGGNGPNPYTDIRQPFDQKFHLILNLAVGGGFFNGWGHPLTPDEAREWKNPNYIIDSIRVYTRGDNNQETTDDNVEPNPTQKDPEQPGGGTLTLTPTSDIYVRGGTYSNNNYKSESRILVKHASIDDFMRQSYLKFDVSKVNLDPERIQRAYLRLRVADDLNPNVDYPFSAGIAICNTWTEGGMTYNNKPDSVHFMDVNLPSDENSIQIELTNNVKAALTSPLKQFTVHLFRNSGDEPQILGFYSRESNNPPQLFVFYGSEVDENDITGENYDNGNRHVANNENSGSTIGIIVGVLAAVVAVVALVIALFIRRRKNRGEEDPVLTEMKDVEE